MLDPGGGDVGLGGGDEEGGGGGGGGVGRQHGAGGGSGCLHRPDYKEPGGLPFV